MTAYVPGCPYCAIVARPPAESTAVVYRGRYSLGVLAPPPAALGHVIAISLDHVPNLFALSAEAAAGLLRELLDYAATLRAEYQPNGLHIGAVGGSAAAQEVPHASADLVARWRGDRLGGHPAGAGLRRRRRPPPNATRLPDTHHA